MIGRICLEQRAGDHRRLACGEDVSRALPEDVVLDRARSLVDDPADRRIEHPADQHIQPRPVQRGQALGGAGRRAEQNARDRDVVESGRQRRHPVGIAYVGVNPGRLDCLGANVIARRAADGVPVRSKPDSE